MPVTFKISPRAFEIGEAKIVALGTYDQFRQNFVNLNKPKTKTEVLSEQITEWSQKAASEGYEKYQQNRQRDGVTLIAVPIRSRDEKERIALARIVEKENLRNRIYQKFNPEVIKKVTGMTEDHEIIEFMVFCDFDDQYVLDVNEYTLMEQIALRYELFKRKKRGRAIRGKPGKFENDDPNNPNGIIILMETLTRPSYKDIEAAALRMAGLVHHTPVLTSSAINEMTGLEAYFKCENFQKVGAFKYRGATNAILSLSDEQAARGVATHSSGNHAAALALAARKRGIPCYVAMPENAPQVKIEAVRHYGAEITFCEPTLQSREDTLKDIIRRTGAVFIHPFDNFDVISGQGTAAKEFLEEVPGLDILLVPVGGGGLLSGSSIAAKSIKPGILVYGCEPANADDAFRSFHSG